MTHERERRELPKDHQLLVHELLEELERGNVPWRKPWTGGEHFNFSTQKKYTGKNQKYLQFLSTVRGIDDPRWMTFKQIQDLQKDRPEVKLKKGSKGVTLYFYSVYDKELKRNLSSEELSTMSVEELRRKEAEDLLYYNKRGFTVFNATQMEGIEAFQKPSEVKYPIHKERIETIAENMSVQLCILYQNKAYYSPLEDKVVLPTLSQFQNQEDFYSVALHELSHATSHESRLHRPLNTSFGTPEYAKEELRAEISSFFLSKTFEINNQNAFHGQQNAAYIRNWIQVLKEEPEALFDAIYDASKISDYIIERAHLDESEKYIIKAEEALQQDQEDFEEDWQEDEWEEEL